MSRGPPASAPSRTPRPAPMSSPPELTTPPAPAFLRPSSPECVVGPRNRPYGAAADALRSYRLQEGQPLGSEPGDVGCRSGRPRRLHPERDPHLQGERSRWPPLETVSLTSERCFRRAEGCPSERPRRASLLGPESLRPPSLLSTLLLLSRSRTTSRTRPRTATSPSRCAG